MVVLPENWFGVALVLLALALLMVDLKVTNHGLPTVGGLGALVLGVLILFDFLPPIRKRKHKLVIVTVDLAADLVEQSCGIAFKKPQHRTTYRPRPFQR